MSHHEQLLMVICGVISLIILWKWEKSLQVIVSLELVTLILIGGLCMTSVFSGIFVPLVLFFVGEALIILSSLMSIIRSVGSSFSVVSLT